MTDFFALLQEPRRPWLDTGVLKQKFLALSARIHPDKVRSDDEAEKTAIARRFAEMNEAIHCLTEPKSRLLHLLELESGAKPADIQQIPPGLADLFVDMATVCKEADAFLVEKNKATSPLLQVRFFDQAQEWIEKLGALRRKLDDLRGRLENELKSLDQAWMERTDSVSRRQILPQLEELYRLFSYFNRWGNQVQERAVQLML